MATMTMPLTELPEDFRPMTREEFMALAETGIWDDQHVELVGGVLIEMSPPGPQHTGVHVWMTKQLVRGAGDDFSVSAQNPLAIDPISQPQPDFAVLRDPTVRWIDEIPSEAVLVVEIAKSNLRFDLGEKARRYAASGYGEYWVVEVERRQVHVHRGPQPDGTWRSVVVHRDGRLAVEESPQLVIDLDELFA